MIDIPLIVDSIPKMLMGIGLTLQLLFLSGALGLALAVVLLLMRISGRWYLAAPTMVYIYIFRGTPLLIQFFIGYLLFASLGAGVFRTAAYGAAVVLFFNTACYAAEILYGAYRAVPNSDLEAARAYGRLLDALRRAAGIDEPVRLEHVIRYNDVFTTAEEDPATRAQMWQAVEAALAEAIGACR